MITIPSTEVLLVVVAILLALMLCQWFIGGMSRRDPPGQRPEMERRISARVSFHQSSLGVSRRTALANIQER
jgi:hypothetical protein